MKYENIESAITVDSVAPFLTNRVIGKKLYTFNQLGSTNDHLRLLAQNGEEEGAVVTADQQTRGRGRHQRHWFSAPGKGLWFSVLLRPASFWDRVGLISLLSSLAVADAFFEQAGLAAAVKWPNDVLSDGRKISGILMETETRSDRPSYLCVGIGVNVNHEKADFPEPLRQRATSLLIESGKSINRAQLLVGILNKLEDYYRRFLDGEHDHIRREWLARCYHKQSFVQVTRGDSVIEGHFEQIDAGGSMLLRTSSGELCRIQSGEVTQLANATQHSAFTGDV